MGKVAIQSLDDERLRALAATRPSSPGEAKDKISDIETALSAAKTRHNMLFGTRTVGQEVQASLQVIASLDGELDWAKKDLVDRERYAEVQCTNAAREANNALPRDRLFEVKGRDGRVFRHRAASADRLRKELTAGYEVTAEVFGAAPNGTGGFSVSVDQSVPTFFESFVAAFGEELCSYLAERGFVIRRDA